MNRLLGVGLSSLLLFSSLAGCVESASICTDVMEPGGDPEGAYPVTLWITNGREEPACLDVRLDGSKVFEGVIEPSGEPGGHGHESYGTFNWSGEEFDVTVTSGEHTTTDTFIAEDENHLIVTVGQNRVSLQHVQSEPAFL